MSDFSGNSHSGTEAIAFGARALNSELFRELFREGMALVEETAAYLDGEGRTESRSLGRAATLAYSTESMRLTTRLMQIASWLLMQRAVNEGEMSPDQARSEKNKVRLDFQPPVMSGPLWDELPATLRASASSTWTRRSTPPPPRRPPTPSPATSIAWPAPSAPAASTTDPALAARRRGEAPGGRRFRPILRCRKQNPGERRSPGFVISTLS
jgi:regulator of CtrA degradation